MQIEFVNHASFIIREKNVSLICDPWLSQPVFDGGWDLIAKSKFKISDFENINYIWISHEHPDHFHINTLNLIDPNHRKNISVFYKYTYDKKVISYLNRLNFKDIIVIEENIPYKLCDGISIT